MLLAEHHQIALPVAEFSTLRDALWPVGQALCVEDMRPVMSAVATRPAAPPVFGKMATKLRIATVFGIGKTIDRLMAHADRMAFQPHPACDLFGYTLESRKFYYVKLSHDADHIFKDLERDV